jgi:hypothetical protein
MTTTAMKFLSLLHGLHSFRYQVTSVDGTTSDGIAYPLAVGGYRSTECCYHGGWLSSCFVRSCFGRRTCEGTGVECTWWWDGIWSQSLKYRTLAAAYFWKTSHPAMSTLPIAPISENLRIPFAQGSTLQHQL